MITFTQTKMRNQKQEMSHLSEEPEWLEVSKGTGTSPLAFFLTPFR